MYYARMRFSVAAYLQTKISMYYMYVQDTAVDRYVCLYYKDHGGHTQSTRVSLCTRNYDRKRCVGFCTYNANMRLILAAGHGFRRQHDSGSILFVVLQENNFPASLVWVPGRRFFVFWA